jgi:type VI protein secretion system component VasK
MKWHKHTLEKSHGFKKERKKERTLFGFVAVVGLPFWRFFSCPVCRWVLWYWLCLNTNQSSPGRTNALLLVLITVIFFLTLLSGA